MTLAILLAAALPAAAQAASPGRFAAAVQNALVAMGDGNEAGTVVTDAIRASGARVVAERLGHPSELRRGDDGKPVIVLDSGLPLEPRVLAPRLAREGAKLALAGMPDCAEKRYMQRSLEVRSWLDLGGEPAKLPVIEPLTGYSDPALAAEFKVWLDEKPEMALYKLGQAAGVEDLPTMTGSLETSLATIYSTPENIAERRLRLRALEAANRRFVQFLLSEKDWRQTRGL